jgi:hypothetical protein
MAQPLNIPILYTGKNVARPDWRGYTQDQNQRIAQLSQQRQQQRQFEALQNERMRKDFLNSIDIDDVNFTNEGLLSQKYQITKGVEDYMTQVLTEREGEVTDEDIMTVRMLSNRANQEINKLNNWQKNQEIDKRAALQNMNLYDQQKLKDNIYNWDGRSPYNESRLESALRDMPIEEVIETTRADIKNPNTFTTISEISGNKVTDKTTYDRAYYTRENGNLIPNDKAQIDYIKVNTARGNDAVLKQRSIDTNFGQLSPTDQQSYANKAVKAGAKPEDGKYLWLRDQGGMFPTESDLKVQEIDEDKADGRKKLTTLDLRDTTEGDFSEAAIKLEGTHTIIREDGTEDTLTVKPNRLKVNRIAYEENPITGQKEWMVSGSYVRPLSENEIGYDPDVPFEKTKAEPIKIPYTDIKENIGRKFNVLLPTQVEETEVDLGF